MKKVISRIDKPLFFATIILSIIGLIMVFSSSSATALLRYHKSSSSYFFTRQLVAFILSYGVGFLLLFINTKRYNLKTISTLTLIIFGALIYVLLQDKVTNNVQSWIQIPIINYAYQPSESAKGIIILFMAVYYDVLLSKKSDKFILYLIPIGIIILFTYLIYKQPDLGSAVIFLGVSFLIFLKLPIPKKHLIKIGSIIGGIILLGGLVLIISGKQLLSEYQLNRLKFTEPCQRYVEDTGYQVCNAEIAVNAGGLFGVGLGNSTQKYRYLPESHTDFIFAILVEELGLLSGIFVILLYIFILYRILLVAKKAHTIKNSVIAYGTFVLFAFHIIINLGGLLALIPITGVPLPLLSYGGSSTLNFIIMLFLVQRVAIENKIAQNKIELEKLTN